MIKKITSLAGAIALLFSTTAVADAGFSIGASGSAMLFETSGSETLKATSVRTQTATEEVVMVPSVFAEYDLGIGGLSLGIEMVVGTGEIGNKKRQTTDITDSVISAAAQVDQKVSAEVENHITYYVEKGFEGGGFLTAGYSTVDITTQDALGTGASYGNTNTDGWTIGAGVKSGSDAGLFWKGSVHYTDYDEIKLNSTTDSTETGDTKFNVVTADSDAVAAKVSIGYKF